MRGGIYLQAHKKRGRKGQKKQNRRKHNNINDFDGLGTSRPPQGHAGQQMRGLFLGIC